MNLSQEEINAMLSGQMSGSDSDESNQDSMYLESGNEVGGMDSEGWDPSLIEYSVPAEYTLTPYEEDTLGEVGNMCMGAVATTMYTLLDKRVSITTPRVSVHTTRDVLSGYKIPFVMVEVQYVEGIEGKNLLLLKEPDAALITDLLMGGEGIVEEPVELNEMHMSAISEIMNQMIGASATALSKLIHSHVNISPPKSDRVAIDADLSGMLDYSQVVVKVSFDMEIEGLLKSQLIQLMPFSLARDLAKRLIEVYAQEEVETNKPSPSIQTPPQAPPPQMPSPQTPAPYPEMPAQNVGMSYPTQNDYAANYAPPNSTYANPAGAYDARMPSYAQPQPPAPSPGNLVDVRPLQFNSFDNAKPAAPLGKGLDMVYDIPLQVSVELGKTKKEISEILEFGMGTVIVLDKIAGDPVEILANGKLIARGEVVVIDENYGVRITELFNN